MRSLLFAFGLIAFAAVPRASAQSVAGEWDASMNTPGGVRNFKIIFEVRGDSLSGTVKRDDGDFPLRGTVSGDIVKFGYVINYRGNDLPLAVSMKVDGDSMDGTVDINGAAEERFWARRVGASPQSHDG